MTIKELCEKSSCGNCVYFSICMLNEVTPCQMDELSIKVLSDTIIETARILLEDETIKDKLNLMYGNVNNVYVDTDSIKVREDENND